ncbi:MAG: hypothetical protein AAF740_11550 [Bacteroidota bacterium]
MKVITYFSPLFIITFLTSCLSELSCSKVDERNPVFAVAMFPSKEDKYTYQNEVNGELLVLEKQYEEIDPTTSVTCGGLNLYDCDCTSRHSLQYIDKDSILQLRQSISVRYDRNDTTRIDVYFTSQTERGPGTIVSFEINNDRNEIEIYLDELLQKSSLADENTYTFRGRGDNEFFIEQHNGLVRFKING